MARIFFSSWQHTDTKHWHNGWELIQWPEFKSLKPITTKKLMLARHIFLTVTI